MASISTSATVRVILANVNTSRVYRAHDEYGYQPEGNRSLRAIQVRRINRQRQLCADQVYYDPEYNMNEGTQMDDFDEDEDGEDYDDGHLTISDEDMAEFRARNIERGTAASHWY